MQASLHATDPGAYPEPWISMVALRDDVLRDEFRAKERARIWEVVKGLVEGNANVRTMVREGRTGEVSRMWEWIGAIQRIEYDTRRLAGVRVVASVWVVVAGLLERVLGLRDFRCQLRVTTVDSIGVMVMLRAMGLEVARLERWSRLGSGRMAARITELWIGAFAVCL